MENSPASGQVTESWAAQFAELLRAQRARADEFLATHQARLEQVELVVQQELNRLEEELLEEYEEVDRLRAQHSALTAKISELEAKLTEAQKNLDRQQSQVDNEENEDFRRRYEMAMEDIRQLRNKNTELQHQLMKARATASKLAQQSRQTGTLDWETEKRRILAALEADAGENEEIPQPERLKIEEVIRSTDEIVAAKDKEIENLKKQLEEARSAGPAVTPTEALEKALETDAFIRQERERLARLQDEWREKLRQAEVDLSLERAKLARQRAELEEQLRAAGKSHSETTQQQSEEKTERSASTRWLARLGLTDADREPPRRP